MYREAVAIEAKEIYDSQADAVVQTALKSTRQYQQAVRSRRAKHKIVLAELARKRKKKKV